MLTVLADQIDRETDEELNLEVEVSDSGKPSKSQKVPVRITVNDVNDNNPVVSPSFIYTEVAIPHEPGYYMTS